MPLPARNVETPGCQLNWDAILKACPQWPTVPQCRVTHSTTTSCNSGSPTALPFDTETYDLGFSVGMHDTATLNTRLYVRVAGLYAVTGIVSWTANSTGVRGAGVGRNGSAVVWQVAPTVTAPDIARNCVVDHLRLVVGDYLELFAYQTSGGALTTTSAETSFKAAWLSP